jgi:hypothetical protein
MRLGLHAAIQPATAAKALTSSLGQRQLLCRTPYAPMLHPPPCQRMHGALNTLMCCGRRCGAAAPQELRIACALGHMERLGGVAPVVSPLAQVGALSCSSPLASLPVAS